MPKIRVNNVELYYETAGEGEPLLLLHGLGSSVRDWERQIPEMAQSYRVIACDVCGHGRSEKPPGPYSMPQFARDTADLLHGARRPVGSHLRIIHGWHGCLPNGSRLSRCGKKPDYCQQRAGSGPEEAPRARPDRLTLPGRALVRDAGHGEDHCKRALPGSRAKRNCARPLSTASRRTIRGHILIPSGPSTGGPYWTAFQELTAPC